MYASCESYAYQQLYPERVCYIQSVSELLAANLEEVKNRIRSAALRSGRDPSEIKLVAVTKTHPASVVREALAAGLSIFGENKVQEADTKIPELGSDAAEWHLIGHLQSN